MKKPRVAPLAFPTGAVTGAMERLMGEAEDHKARVQSEFIGQDAAVAGMGPMPQRVHEPGGSPLSVHLLHPGFTIFERQFEVEQDEGWFSSQVSPTRPVSFELGAFRVPKSNALWLMDYEFQVLRPSGIDPGEFVVAEAGRYLSQVGFDVTINNTQRQGNIQYQLVPQPAANTRATFAPPVGSPTGAGSGAFGASVGGSFGSTASPGKSLLPVRSSVQGPRNGPFTFVIEEGSTIALSAYIFRPFLSPVAAILGRMAGWMLQTNVSNALIQRMRPQ